MSISLPPALAEAEVGFSPALLIAEDALQAPELVVLALLFMAFFVGAAL